METTESRIFKAEVFIILKTNSAQDLNSSLNEIDDLKLANKLKIATCQVEETTEDQTLFNKFSDTENCSLSPIDTKTHESAESLCTSDSSKKASINSFNEYQEEPDFEILVKSPELLESYSNQLEIDRTSSPLEKTFSGIKKCLVNFMHEQNKSREESISIEGKDENGFVFNDSFKQSTKMEIETVSFSLEIGEDVKIGLVGKEEEKGEEEEEEEKEEKEEEVKTFDVEEIIEELKEGEIEERKENEQREQDARKEEQIKEEQWKEKEDPIKEQRKENKVEKERIETEEATEPVKIEENNLKIPKFTDFHKPVSKSEQPIYDEPFVGNLHRNPKISRPKLDVEYVQTVLSNIKNHRLSAKHPKRCNSLKSIDEGVEIVDTNFDDICYHGHKNGCTVAAQRPQDVSQEVFKDNWMQRLESLRQKEALLKDKEIALQSRERLLFKKEKELRILERMVKDKMKQAELYLKRCKNSQSLENVFDEKYVDSKSSEGSAGSKAALVLNVANAAKRVPFVGESHWLQAPELKYDLTKDNLRSLPPSRCSYSTIPSDAKYGSKFSTYSSFRCRPKPKMSYDDMDSTLSADVGDSSLIVTSRKFDPVVFKKPVAFSRSASERRPKVESKSVIAKEQFIKEEGPEFEENKIFKKVSENIFASQDKETKFQNYGIIDKAVKTLDRKLAKSEEEVKRCGYLNLEVDNKEKKKSSKGLKSRPVSWSAETDDWLQKKREAFNTANKKCVKNCDKENLDLKPKTISHSTLKKKSWKGKKFSIFR